MKGKEKCDRLRAIRKKIAEQNGIEYTPRECPHEVCSTGTCPLCESEAKHLMEELQKKEASGTPIKADPEDFKALVCDGDPEDPQEKPEPTMGVPPMDLLDDPKEDSGKEEASKSKKSSWKLWALILGLLSLIGGAIFFFVRKGDKKPVKDTGAIVEPEPEPGVWMGEVTADGYLDLDDQALEGLEQPTTEIAPIGEDDDSVAAEANP